MDDDSLVVNVLGGVVVRILLYYGSEVDLEHAVGTIIVIVKS